MSDFHPPITDLADWNTSLTQCGCCPMPECELPSLECETAGVVFCFHVKEVTEPEFCAEKYTVHTFGRAVNGSQQTITLGKVTYKLIADYQLTTTETYETPLARADYEDCELTTTCTIEGAITETFWSYYETATVSGTPTMTYGPFLSQKFVTRLANWAGLGDPTWSPGVGQTEANRPILAGPCAPVATITSTTYTPTYDVAGHVNGSVVSSVTVSYSKWVMGAFVADGFPSAWITHVDDFSGPITCEDLQNALVTYAEDSEDGFEAGDCVAKFLCAECSATSWGILLRYRWKIPPCHPGSWYQIEWDEVFFPQAYLDWYAAALADIDGIEVFDPNASPPPELPVLTPKAYTWTGTALGACDEEDPENNYDFRSEIVERISPWSNIVVPPAAGEVEIRNARVRCYQNPFGTVAQTIPGFDVFSLANLDQDSNLDEKEPI